MRRRVEQKRSMNIIFILFISNLILGVSCSFSLYASATSTGGDCLQTQTACSLSEAITTANNRYENETVEIYMLEGEYQLDSAIPINNFLELTISAYELNKVTITSIDSVFLIRNSKLRLVNIEFTRCKNTVLKITNSLDISLDSCSFTNNVPAEGYTNASLITTTDTHVTIINSNITANGMHFENYQSKYVYGGLISGSTWAASLTIKNTLFASNFITGTYNYVSGGLLSVRGNLNVTLSRFEKNYAKGNFSRLEGLLIACSSTSRISNSTFSENTIEYMGEGEEAKVITADGVFIQATNNLDMTSSSFVGNDLKIFGFRGRADVSALVHGLLMLELNGCNFNHNTIELDLSDANIKTSREEVAMVRGGVVFSPFSDIYNSSFNSNRIILSSNNNDVKLVGVWGTAFYGSFSGIGHSSFIGNSIEANPRSAAFLDNRSEILGGGMFSTFADIDHCDFENNYSVFSGGAVALSPYHLQSVLFNSTTFKSNRADGRETSQGGGAIYVNEVDGNTKEIKVELIDCIFSDNNAMYGADIFLKDIEVYNTRSGNPNVYTYTSQSLTPSPIPQFFSPTRSPSPTLSLFSRSTSEDESSEVESSEDESSEGESSEDGGSAAWWIILVSIFSALGGICLVILCITAVVVGLLLYRKRVSVVEDDDVYQDDEL